MEADDGLLLPILQPKDPTVAFPPIVELAASHARAAWISFWRPASMSAGVTKPMALCKRTVL